MLQLRNRSRATVVALCAAVVSLAGCATVVEGTPQSILQGRVDKLHQRVEAAATPEAKHEAFWTTVCDADREITSGRPAHIPDWERDPLAEQYNEAVRVYWMHLVDADYSGKNSQFPLMRVVEDMANQLDGREPCDFRR